MKSIFLLISFCVTSTLFAQDTVSVLFIGNSYTYANNLPAVTNSIARTFDDSITYSTQTPGGYTFEAHATNNATYTQINSKKWDFVVLQAQSQEPSFPDNQVNTNTLPYAMQIADSVYTNNFCTETLMFMTWGRENGDPQWEPISTFEGMNTRLRNAYLRLADSVQGSVSPVGSAWRYVRDNYPSIQLYSGDGSHPSYAGTYLAACTFYAAIFRKSPMGTSFYGSLDQTTAENLQYAASITVLDSLETWNLRPISEHTQADFDYLVNGTTVQFNNMSTKATNYYWNFGDFNNSIEDSPAHTFGSAGNYTIQLVAESACDQDTVEVEITISSSGIEENQNGVIKLESQGMGFFVVKGIDSTTGYVVFDSSGNRLYKGDHQSGKLEIDLSSYPKGIYYLSIHQEIGKTTLKIPHLGE